MNIELAEVSFSYKKRRRNTKVTELPLVLDQVNVTIRNGEMLAVAGKSGSGKSTFIQLLKGFLKPSFGSVLIDGVDTYAAKRPELFDRVGFIFQYPEHQLFSVTVAEDVSFGLRHSGFSPEQKDEKVKQAMNAVGLDYHTFAKRSPFELSGGEKRRVAIAGVIVLEPEIIILDEPTAGLDYPSRSALFDMLHKLNAERGTTILWVSHQLEEMLEHASRMLILKDGSFIAEGSPEVLLSDIAVLDTMGWEQPTALALAQLVRHTHGIEIPRPWDVSEVAPILLEILQRKLKSDSEGISWPQQVI